MTVPKGRAIPTRRTVCSHVHSTTALSETLWSSSGYSASAHHPPGKADLRWEQPTLIDGLEQQRRVVEIRGKKAVTWHI